jgi:hypothetical protein
VNLRELSTADIDAIRDAVNALTRDLQAVDDTARRESVFGRHETLEWVEASARKLAQLLA